MRTPHRLFPRSLLSARSLSLGLTGFTLLALALAGCKKDEDTTLGQVQEIDGRDVALDARGSSVDSEVQLARVPFEGTAGNGGNIRVTSAGGALTVTSAPRTFVVPTLTFTGSDGVTVRSGERRNMFGAQRVLD